MVKDKSIPLYDDYLESKQEILNSMLHDNLPQVFLVVMKLNSMNKCSEYNKLRENLAKIE
jgi:hypothetical protein